MSIPTTFEFQVTWADLDANRHLKNTGYLDYAAQSRFLYFAAGGFGQQQFAELNIGPRDSKRDHYIQAGAASLRKVQSASELLRTQRQRFQVCIPQ